MEPEAWEFGDVPSRLMSEQDMREALGADATAVAFTTFGGRNATWYAEVWSSQDDPPRLGVYGHAPEPFALLLDDEADETDAVNAAGDALARVVIGCAGADPAIAALHWRRGNGDEVVIAATAESDDGTVEWYAATCLNGRHEAYSCGPDPDQAWPTAAEMVLRHGLIDETDPDTHADQADLHAALALEAWAAEVLARHTRARARSCGPAGFVAGADEVGLLLGPQRPGD